MSLCPCFEPYHFENGDPYPEPPDWTEQEWCDGGFTCLHDACIQDLHDEREEDS